MSLDNVFRTSLVLEIIGHVVILNMGLNTRKKFRKKLDKLLKSVTHCKVSFFYTHSVEAQEVAWVHTFWQT